MSNVLNKKHTCCFPKWKTHRLVIWVLLSWFLQFWYLFLHHLLLRLHYLPHPSPLLHLYHPLHFSHRFHRAPISSWSLCFCSSFPLAPPSLRWFSIKRWVFKSDCRLPVTIGALSPKWTPHQSKHRWNLLLCVILEPFATVWEKNNFWRDKIWRTNWSQNSKAIRKTAESQKKTYSRILLSKR